MWGWRREKPQQSVPPMVSEFAASFPFPSGPEAFFQHPTTLRVAFYVSCKVMFNVDSSLVNDPTGEDSKNSAAREFYNGQEVH